MMQSAGGEKPLSQVNTNYAFNTPGLTDTTGTIFNQFSSLHGPTNAVTYQPLHQHQPPPPYYSSYLAQQPPPSLPAYNPLTNVYSRATAGYPSFNPALQACYSVPSVGATPVFQGTVSNGTTYYYNPPLGGIVEGSGGGSGASNVYVTKNNVPSVVFANQGVVIPPGLQSNKAAFAGLAISQTEKGMTFTSSQDTATTTDAAAAVVHSTSTPASMTSQKSDQQGSSVFTSNSACVDKYSLNRSGSIKDNGLSSNNQGYDGSSRRQQDRRDQNGHAQKGKANLRKPDQFPSPNLGNGQSNPSSYSNSDFARGKRRDNFNSNSRGRGGAVYYNSSVCDDEDRNRGRTAVLAEAAAFMSNLNMGAGTSTSTGEILSSNESPRRGEYSRDRGRYQMRQQSGMKQNPPRLMEGAYGREENDTRFGRGGRHQYAFEGRGRGDRKGGGARGRGRGGAGGGFQEESTVPKDEQQATGHSSGPNRMGDGGRRGGLGRNDAIEGERNNRNWNNRNRFPGYGEEKSTETSNNSMSNLSRNDKTTPLIAKNQSTSPETSEASFLYDTSNTNHKQNPFLGRGRNPSTCRDHRGGTNSTNEQPEDNLMALKGPSRNFRPGAVKMSGNSEEDTKNQRDELTDLLQRGTYECMVCCDRVRPQQAIWSCRLCYNCFHLGCIKKWANSSTKEGESGWRCPGCNNQSAKRPNSYMCFCGKLREPEYNRRDVPHSCGELCGRARELQTWCTHRCNVLCHPGPCPPCLAYIKKWCGCGATSKDVRCSNGADALLCGAVCGKPLSCTRHTCQMICHEGECGDCETQVQQVCHCGKTKRSVECRSDSHDVLTFECGERCDRLLECGHHHCHQECHVGPCQPCQLTVDRITHCPCGKKSLKEIHAKALSAAAKKTAGADAPSKSLCSLADEKDSKKSRSKGTGSKVLKDDAVSAEEDSETGVEKYGSCTKDDTCPTERRACTDPVPTCGAVCGKKLRCGKPGSFHTCQNLCHEGPCSTCPLKTSVRCRCGSMDQNVECSKLLTKADEVTCEKQCKKLRFCGRHRCGAKCCIDVDHVCPLRCSKYLPCGNHRCTDTCHRGNCQRCWESSWEELTCHCGASVTFPPVPCGTKPPVCNQLCSRGQLCTHPVSHTCHPEESCPPCTMLMAAPCFGGHKTMKSTPCYLKAVSCGDLCDKPLACGFHKCNKVCHDGPCVKVAASATQQQKCPQKCTKLRSTCGHHCNQPCHPGHCPNTSCKEKVTVTCKCGLRSSVLSCAENEREYRTMATAKLASQLHHVRNSDDSVDLSHILTAQTTSKERFKRLECNDACHSKERASRLALALQIENPESRSSLGTAATAASYSDFLKDEAKKDPQFGNMVHQALTSLVIKARESKQRNRSHSFAPMSRDKRQFIHEYCKFFGCSSMAYDEEPKKNVVVTAQRGMCLLPMNSVVSVMQRENGHKKVPGPVWGPRRPASPQLSELRSPSNNGGFRKLEKGGSLEREGDTTPTATEAGSSLPVIDYFDFDE